MSGTLVFLLAHIITDKNDFFPTYVLFDGPQIAFKSFNQKKYYLEVGGYRSNPILL